MIWLVVKNTDLKQSLWRSVGVVFSYFCLLCFTYKMNNLCLWIFVWPILGFILSGCFSALHYCSHNTLYTNTLTNRLCGVLWSLPVLMNFSSYKFFHLEHHKFTSIAGDTEPAGDLKSIWTYMFYCLNWDFIYAFFRLSVLSLVNLYPAFIRTKKAQKDVKIDTLILFAFLVFFLFLTYRYPLVMIYCYWIPLQICFILNFIITLGEHFGCANSTNVLKNTRTFYITNVFFRFFYWNSNFHAEHHLFPKIRPWDLPKKHAEIAHQLMWIESSYISFTWKVLKGLSLKIPFYLPQSSTPQGRRKNFLFPLF